jgi:hypothetical protein
LTASSASTAAITCAASTTTGLASSIRPSCAS